MGLFGGSETYVASTLYNMAGPEADRPNYLKTLVAGGMIGRTGSREGMGEIIRRGYGSSPLLRVRSFFRWAEDNYQAVGVPQGSLGSVIKVDPAVIQAALEADLSGAEAGMAIRLQRADAGFFDYTWWAEEWVMRNHPSLAGTNWVADVDDALGTVKIVFADGSEASFIPTANRAARYVYALYNLLDESGQAPGGELGRARIMIYRVGSGKPALDAMVKATDNDGEYVPYIPVRIDNKFISPQYKPATYQAVKKAYKKAIGGDFDELVEKVADNPDLGEIDYAYVMFGVPLNVRENASRRYLFDFFDRCRQSQATSAVEWAAYEAASSAYDVLSEAWQNWRIAQDDPASGGYGSPEPYVPVQPVAAGSEVRIKSASSTGVNLDMLIQWGAISRTTGTGLGKPGARKGDVWLTVLNDDKPASTVLINGKKVETTSGKKFKSIRIWFQTTATSWQSLKITNLVHRNLIYNNKSVVIAGSEALEDVDDSGFLVPLHYATLREMGMVQSTQMMTAATYIVFNSYKVVKKKWYETGIFKIVLFVVIIAISVATMGTGAGLSVGLLGSAAAVGAAIGLSGVIAIIAGTIINALAAMILSQLIMAASTLVLGEKWGQIVGTVLAFVALNVGTAFSNGASLAEAFNSLMSAQNIIQMTSSVGSGVSGLMSASAAETYRRAEDLARDNALQMRDLADRFAEEFGYGNAFFSPLSLTDIPLVAGLGNPLESEAEFLSRTLLTGSDVAELTHDMITNFTSYTLSLDPRHA